jgi:hypothetical protein
MRTKGRSEPDYVRMKPHYLRTDQKHRLWTGLMRIAIFLSGWLSMEFGLHICLEVNPIQVWALGTVDFAKREVRFKAYAV